MTAFLDGFVLGTDQSIVITNNQTGANVTLDGRRTSFESEPREKLETSEPVDQGGLVEDALIPGGWEGTIMVDKKGDDFSALYAYLEDQFYKNGLRQKFTIVSYEPNADKSAIAVYRYTKVTFHGYKPGTWARERVKPQVKFVAQERKKDA